MFKKLAKVALAWLLLDLFIACCIIGYTLFHYRYSDDDFPKEEAKHSEVKR